jgi:hypothetical protein
MGWSLHQINVKIILLNRVIEEVYVEQPQGFEVYQKETLVCRWKKTCMDSSKLGAEPLMYSRSVVKTSYDKGSI